ncbi:beta-1,4 N-acetylgalactosaminyltransferase 2-like [Glandiceps talaboti]
MWGRRRYVAFPLLFLLMILLYFIPPWSLIVSEVMKNHDGFTVPPRIDGERKSGGFDNESEVMKNHDGHTVPQAPRTGRETKSDGFDHFCRRLWMTNTAPTMMEYEGDTLTKTCSCQKGPRTFGPYENSSLQRRHKEFIEWERQQDMKREPLIYSPAMSPFGYLVGGLTVQPGKSVPLKSLYIDPMAVECLTVIHGFSFQDKKSVLNFRCGDGKAVMFISPTSSSLTQLRIDGNHTSDLRISMACNVGTLKSSLDRSRSDIVTQAINEVLHNIHYRNIYYDVFNRDVINVTFLNLTFQINVLIKENALPRLYDTGSGDDIANKVTIVTKTFERPDSVLNLIKSIRKYYPSVTIVIADDSEQPVAIHGDNIKHYTMPFAEGWFAGRNLAVSQVRTKYFLWVDDDFEFTALTNLSKCLEKLENNEENIDIVGGVLSIGKERDVEMSTFDKTLKIEDGDMGFCVYRKSGVHRKLRNYPQCHVTNIVLNFFMAKTLSVRNIGFDPHFERVGHSEFFFDGFGYLRVATCSDFIANHRPSRPKKYMRYRNRQVDPTDEHRNVQYILYKNYLQCFELN